MGSLVCLLACCLNDPKDFDRMRVLITRECTCLHTALVISRAMFLIHRRCIWVNVPKSKTNC